MGTCGYPVNTPWISSVRIRSFLLSSSGYSQGWAVLDRSAQLSSAPWPDSLAGLFERPFVPPPRILGLLAPNLPLPAKEEMSVVCGPGFGPQGQTSGNS